MFSHLKLLFVVFFGLSVLGLPAAQLALADDEEAAESSEADQEASAEDSEKEKKKKKKQERNRDCVPSGSRIQRC